MRALCLLLLALCLTPDIALSAQRIKVTLPPLHPLTADCVLDAARVSGMPVAVLFAILATEGGKMGEALSNKNGTWDLGGFQINTVHLKDLAAMGISPDAAWLLRKEYRRTGNLWQAIGAYHSRTPHRRDAYIRRVQANLKKLRQKGLSMLPLQIGEKRQ